MTHQPGHHLQTPPTTRAPEPPFWAWAGSGLSNFGWFRKWEFGVRVGQMLLPCTWGCWRMRSIFAVLVAASILACCSCCR